MPARARQAARRRYAPVSRRSTAAVSVFGDLDLRADAPTIRVRVLGFGTVDVWRVPPGLGGDFGEVIRELRAQQKRLSA